MKKYSVQINRGATTSLQKDHIKNDPEVLSSALSDHFECISVVSCYFFSPVVICWMGPSFQECYEDFCN